MGGTDDLITAALLSEELARVFPALEGIMIISLACARYMQAAPEELKTRALPALLTVCLHGRARQIAGGRPVRENGVGSLP
jgi:hypothetical protein